MTDLFKLSLDNGTITRVIYGHATANVINQFWQTYCLPGQKVIIENLSSPTPPSEVNL